MWLLSTILFAVLFDIPILLAALAGAIVTPTDPVVASSIVSGRFAQNHLSKKIRLTLSFESGANDGLAFPLVALPLLLLTQSNPLGTWLSKSFLWEMVGGIIFGYIGGSLAGKLIHTAHDKNWMTEKSLLASSLALAFTITGGLELLQMNSIIAVFAGGLAFNGHISKEDDLADEKIQKMMERLFIIPIFFFIGLILPLDQWIREGWSGAAGGGRLVTAANSRIFSIKNTVTSLFKDRHTGLGLVRAHRCHIGLLCLPRPGKNAQRISLDSIQCQVNYHPAL